MQNNDLAQPPQISAMCPLPDTFYNEAPDSRDLETRPKRIAKKTGLTTKEVNDRIHKAKKGGMPPKPNEGRGNPDMGVDTSTGEIYPLNDDGSVGDSIGNIYDDF